MGEGEALNLSGREGPPADWLVVGCLEGEAPIAGVTGAPDTGSAGDLGAEVTAALARLAGRPGWRGSDEQTAQTEAGPAGTVVSLFGLGAAADFSYPKLTRWLGRALEEARQGGARQALVVLPRHAETAGEAAERVLRAAALATYRFDRFQTDGDKGHRLASVAVRSPDGSAAAYAAALATARAVVAGVTLARDLANTPGNEAGPSWMEERAAAMAAERGLDMAVLGRAELAARGMGGILAVGAGSEDPPRLVRLAYGEEGPLIALVGKGVTFDSGGLSIKTSAAMADMKYDKSGACAVLGAVQAVADLALPVRLRAYLPLAENMLSGKAYRPGDIVRCYNGKTVEITDTDAEGRMILADALAWAAEERPDSIVELSTLTGHCVVTLGNLAAGLFTPHEGLASELLAASGGAGERLWRLPLYPEFLEEMKGTQADLRNSAGRYGGASLAAAFLSQFVGAQERWAHLDIAGVANVKPEPHATLHGATGFGVASLVTWLRRLAS
jgi:leucyl aminopeptidase